MRHSYVSIVECDRQTQVITDSSYGYFTDGNVWARRLSGFPLGYTCNHRYTCTVVGNYGLVDGLYSYPVCQMLFILLVPRGIRVERCLG
jgi:hypothetical protein